MVRKAIVAGQFYNEDKTVLKQEVENYLKKAKKEEVKACIVPHAGYFFSGLLAGKVIGKIRNKKKFIIIGVNHSGIGDKLSFSLEDFETPLGIVKNSKGLGKKIFEKLRKKVESKIDEEPHASEHSIEVILPFLQLSQRKFEIVPILPRDLSYEECKEVASVLSNFIYDDICVVVSSDFTHYGFNYGFLPFTSNIKENLYLLDKEIIDSILALDSKSTYEKARKSTVCGVYGIAILTELAKLKGWRGKLVEYYTSGDIVNDWRNAVGYAGVIFQ